LVRMESREIWCHLDVFDEADSMKGKKGREGPREGPREGGREGRDIPVA